VIPGRRLEDRIRELCAKAATASDAETAQVLQELRDALHEHARHLRALAAEKLTLPPVQPVDMSRDELAKQPQIPPVLALMFSMAKGTAKRLEMPQNNGWMVAKLDDVSVPTLAINDPAVADAQQQLGSLYGDEYAQELIKAAQRAVGVKKNQAAIDAVAKQLTGQSQ